MAAEAPTVVQVETPLFGIDQVTYSNNTLNHIEFSTFGVGHLDLGEIGLIAAICGIGLEFFSRDATFMEMSLKWGGLTSLIAYHFVGI